MKVSTKHTPPLMDVTEGPVDLTRRMTGGQVCSWLILLALTLVSYNKQITSLGFYLIMELKFQKVISKIIIVYILK